MAARKTAQPTGKTIAYLRVSTLDQDLEKNKADILHFANHHDLGKVLFVEEVASGRKPWRERQIAQVLEELQGGDAIIVAELSRLGRSMLECMEILALAMRKSIRVYSVKGSWQLDNSIQSKIIALAFSMAAEIERDLISQRQRKRCASRRNRGLPSVDLKGLARASWMPFDRKSKVYWRTDQPRNSSPIVTTRRKRTFTTGSRSTG